MGMGSKLGYQTSFAEPICLAYKNNFKYAPSNLEEVLYFN